MLSSALSLTHFDRNLEMIPVTDTSVYDVGAVLLHKPKEGSQNVIAKASRRLLPAGKIIVQLQRRHWRLYQALKSFTCLFMVDGLDYKRPSPIPNDL